MTRLNAGDRLLVLGAAGFIGSYLPAWAKSEGVELRGFDCYELGFDGYSDFRLGDIRDVEAVTRAMDGCDAVLNLAAAHHDFGIPEETFESVNVGGAVNVCAAAEKLGVSNICFYSSVAVYGSGRTQPGETDEPAPENPYGRTKLAAERVYLDWAGDSKRALVIRPAVVFGPRNYANTYTLIDQIARGRFWPVGKGSNHKSMAYVENLVAAMGHVWTQSAAYSPEIYDYVDKPDLTSEQVISAVYRALGKSVPPFSMPQALALAGAVPFDLIAKTTGRNLPITSARIRKLSSAETAFAAERIVASGFRPAVPLEEGLRRMVAWYQEGGKDAHKVIHLPPEV